MTISTAPRTKVARAGLALLAATCAGLLAQPATAQKTFCEEDGLVVMQIESAPLVPHWVEENIVPQSTGTYYRWNGPNQFTNPGLGILPFQIKITTPGNYNFRWRNFHFGPDAGEHNDAWIRMDGGQWEKCYSAGIDQWNWHTLIDGPSFDYEPVFNLSAGDHLLEISGRSFDFRIDRMHLYLDGVPSPTNPSKPETDNCTWQDLGQGLAGSVGTPELEGTGTLGPSTPVALTVSGALPAASTGLVVGFGLANVPFKGGMLVPDLDVLIGFFSTNGSGGLVLAGTWPALPSGTTLYYQAWIADAGGPLGFSATNGLSGTVP
jgi:hypothetical protein